MRAALSLLTACLLCTAWAQEYTTPVPILKQINRHNEDGSYSYGYEAADGTFKIETKYPTGEVYGKYGYVDDVGKVREVEYGASRRGFEPAGSDINVPPPTISQDPKSNSVLPDGVEDDGQYREDPAVYYKDAERYNSKPAAVSRPSYYRPQAATYNPPAPVQQQYRQPQQAAYNPPQATYSQPQATYNPPQPTYNPPQPAYNPPQQSYTQQYNTYNQQQAYNQRPAQPYQLNAAQFVTHPAVKNIDYFSGSYSVDYKKK